MSARRPVTVIVPMKPLVQAKTRLRGHLDTSVRARLSEAMLTSVLETVRDSTASKTIVVGGDDRVESIACKYGAQWTADKFSDLNLAVADSFAYVWHSQHAAAYIPADLPLLSVSDLDDMFEFALAGQSLTICPAHDGGTNGLVAPPGLNFRPRLGADSHRRHRELAVELGTEMREYWSPGFERDVDTIADLRWCIDRGAPCLRCFQGSVEDSYQ